MHEAVLPLHLLTLTVVAVTIFQADHLGFDWMRGKKNFLPADIVRKLHTRTWIGLSFMVASGFLIFWPMREYLLTRPQFYIKMAFVFALAVNAFVIGRFQKVATEKSYKELSKRERFPLLLSGAVSTVSWAGAVIMAFFLIPD